MNSIFNLDAYFYNLNIVLGQMLIFILIESNV